MKQYYTKVNDMEPDEIALPKTAEELLALKQAIVKLEEEEKKRISQYMELLRDTVR